MLWLPHRPRPDLNHPLTIARPPLICVLLYSDLGSYLRSDYHIMVLQYYFCFFSFLLLLVYTIPCCLLGVHSAHFNQIRSVAHYFNPSDLRVPLALKQLAIASFLQTWVSLWPQSPRVVYSLLISSYSIVVPCTPGPGPRICIASIQGLGLGEEF